MKNRFTIAAVLSLGLSATAQAGFFDQLEELNKKVDEMQGKVTETSTSAQETVDSAQQTSATVKQTATMENASDMLESEVNKRVFGTSGNSSMAPSGLPDLATGLDIFGVDLGYYTKPQLEATLSSPQLAKFANNPKYTVSTQGRDVMGKELFALWDFSVLMREDMVCKDVAKKAIKKYSNEPYSRLDVASGSKRYTWGGSKVDLKGVRNVEKKQKNFIKKMNKMFESSGTRLVGKTDNLGDGSQMLFEITCNKGLSVMSVFRLTSGTAFNAINQYNSDYVIRQRKANAASTPEF
ncbi:hypothetical protein [Ketobacter sp.]|uniref:hypothetical protein n=1 Tax=Ketobacter sp. TaxID=2083498 RepID=UPI000F1BC613|nr:hypothetical protein [Ketobacter sp.]RLU00168.1 MAG: hypothetical protein D9N14_06660 [Ketobacter sp.]